MAYPNMLIMIWMFNMEEFSYTLVYKYHLRAFTQNRIADDQVFTCEPRAGQLAVGETVRLQLTYAHRLAGIHQVSAILQVQRGMWWRNVGTVRFHLTYAHRLAGIREVAVILQVQRCMWWRNVCTVRLKLTYAHRLSGIHEVTAISANEVC